MNGSDSWGYYVHLPALFLYDDTGDYSRSIAAWKQHYPNRADPRDDAYGIRATPIGKLAVKYPVGLAILETPFFALAHVFCTLSNTYPADGFSLPYAWAISLSSLFFAITGLFLTYKNLRFHYDERVSLLATGTIGLATNLYFFVAYTQGMSHPAAFFLIALFLLLVRRFYRAYNPLHAMALGACLGMIALVRTQDVVIAVVPLFWGVSSWSDVKERGMFIWEKKRLLLQAVAAFGVMLIPQLFYWYHVSGQFWYDGYQGETFNWLHAQIGRGLFSFTNGWLVYTPVMALALLGIWRLPREWRWPILLFMPIHVYISYAWWCWMYINGFGSRPMVDAYALLAIPLAAWINGVSRKWLLWMVLGVFSAINILQTFQTRCGHYWSERGSWAFYREMLVRPGGSAQAIAAFESKEPQPIIIPENQKLLARIMADTNGIEIGARHAVSGRDEFSHTLTLQNDTTGLVPGQWVHISADAYLPDTSRVPGLDHLARLVADFSPREGKPLKYRSINIATQIGNPDHVLWKANGKGVWGTASFYVKVPPGFDSSCRLTVYIWNPHRQDVFISALRVERVF